jgi:hypothetical protein
MSRQKPDADRDPERETPPERATATTTGGETIRSEAGAARERANEGTIARMRDDQPGPEPGIDTPPPLDDGKTEGAEDTEPMEGEGPLQIGPTYVLVDVAGNFGPALYGDLESATVDARAMTENAAIPKPRYMLWHVHGRSSDKVGTLRISDNYTDPEQSWELR